MNKIQKLYFIYKKLIKYGQFKKICKGVKNEIKYLKKENKLSSNELFICSRVYSSYDTLFRVIRKYGAKLILDIYNYGMAYSGNYEIRNEGLYDAYWLWLTPFETFLSPKIVQKPKINKKKMFPREFFSEIMDVKKDEDDYYYYTRL